MGYTVAGRHPAKHAWRELAAGVFLGNAPTQWGPPVLRLFCW